MYFKDAKITIYWEKILIGLGKQTTKEKFFFVKKWRIIFFKVDFNEKFYVVQNPHN